MIKEDMFGGQVGRVGVVRHIPSGLFFVLATGQEKRPTLENHFYEHFSQAVSPNVILYPKKSVFRKTFCNLALGDYDQFEIVEENIVRDTKSRERMKQLLIREYDTRNPEKGLNY